MSKEINLTSSEWTDIVFEGRNKEYGAYKMRQSASKRHIFALLIVTTLLVFVTYLPSLIKAVIPEKYIDTLHGPTIITDVSVDDKELPKSVVPIEESKPILPKNTITYTPPEITDEEIDKEKEMKSQEDLQESRAQISTQTIVGSNDPGAVDISEIETRKAITEEDAAPVTFVEQMPQFPGGDKELMTYLSKNIKYPTIAAENGIKGKVTIRFVVSKTGEVTDVQILKGLDPACDKEAVRVVKAMPKWIPGRQNGRTVAVYYTLPVTYRLQQ